MSLWVLHCSDGGYLHAPWFLNESEPWDCKAILSHSYINHGVHLRLCYIPIISSPCALHSSICIHTSALLLQSTSARNAQHHGQNRRVPHLHRHPPAHPTHVLGAHTPRPAQPRAPDHPAARVSRGREPGVREAAARRGAAVQGFPEPDVLKAVFSSTTGGMRIKIPPPLSKRWTQDQRHPKLLLRQ